MEQLIYQHLNTYYYVKHGTTHDINNNILTHVKYDAIWYKNHDEGICYWNLLLPELTLIFGLDDDTIKTYVERWAETKHKKINFDTFWKTHSQWSLSTGVYQFEGFLSIDPVKPNKNKNGRVYDKKTWSNAVKNYNSNRKNISKLRHGF